MTTPLHGNSVIDKMRASGMSDDQIMAAIINFGRTQEPTQVPIANSNDPAAQLRAQGFTDEQITAQIVASANAANHAGSGDPTAAGGIAPDFVTLKATLDAHAGTVANVEAAHGAHAERIGGVESDVNDHGDALINHNGRIDDHDNRLDWLENQVRSLLRDKHDSSGDSTQPTDASEGVKG